MSYKSSLIKLAIKWTPKSLITWVANILLKDIAELSALSFDLDTRTAHVQIQLAGEAEVIEVWLEDFALVKEDESYHFFIQQAQSNRLWLTNILARITGKNWKIPVPAHLAAHVDLIAELFTVEAQEPQSDAQEPEESV